VPTPGWILAWVYWLYIAWAGISAMMEVTNLLTAVGTVIAVYFLVILPFIFLDDRR
jgi:hypothetical protein